MALKIANMTMWELSAEEVRQEGVGSEWDVSVLMSELIGSVGIKSRPAR